MCEGFDPTVTVSYSSNVTGDLMAYVQTLQRVLPSWRAASAGNGGGTVVTFQLEGILISPNQWTAAGVDDVERLEMPSYDWDQDIEDRIWREILPVGP